MRALFILVAVMLGAIPASAGDVTVDGVDRSATCGPALFRF